MEHYGYTISKQGFNYPHFTDIRDSIISIIERLNAAYEQNWSSNGTDSVRGRASFVEPRTIEVLLNDGGRARYTAPHILIAVGGHPMVPDIKGAEHGITSDSFFKLEELPSKVAVVGAGYVAVEMTGMMAIAGADTHLFIRGETVMKEFDPRVQRTVTERYKVMGVRIHPRHKGFKEVQLLQNGKGADKLLKLIAKDGEVFEFNEVLWAIGRRPAIEDLNLEIAGVKCKESKHIAVDEYQNTSAAGIYAAGDVTGQIELCTGKLNPMIE